jgi:hypothetical protein
VIVDTDGQPNHKTSRVTSGTTRAVEINRFISDRSYTPELLRHSFNPRFHVLKPANKVMYVDCR